MEKINEEITQLIVSIFLILLGIIVLVIGQFIFYAKRQKRINIEYKIINASHEKELLKTQLEIQEETFNKISKEIHDNISLGLTLAKLQLNNFLEINKTEKSLLISTSIDLISKSLVDLNDISKSLDGDQLASHGLINALESEVSVIGKSGIYQVELEVIGEPLFLNTETELILLRIFQEACNNIIKHARATLISIDMIYEAEFVHMKITDNGKGFDVKTTKEQKVIRKMSGLKNFHKRAELINAEVNITSVIGIGTTIHIKTPIK